MQLFFEICPVGVDLNLVTVATSASANLGEGFGIDLNGITPNHEFFMAPPQYLIEHVVDCMQNVAVSTVCGKTVLVKAEVPASIAFVMASELSTFFGEVAVYDEAVGNFIICTSNCEGSRPVGTVINIRGETITEAV